MLCWLLYAAYPIFSRFIMLLWIYPLLASRFATRFVNILGKKTRAKRQQSLKKDRNRSFSRFDTNLMKRERTVTEREGKKALWKMPIWAERDKTELSRTTKRGLVLSHAVPFYQPHATRPHTTWPHMSARNGQLNGNPPVRAFARGFKLERGENWGKVKRPGKTEYN
jgi:hypothetical protein